MNKPLKKFRAGQISCALWENEIVMNGRNVTMLRATVERRYQDKRMAVRIEWMKIDEEGWRV